MIGNCEPRLYRTTLDNWNKVSQENNLDMKMIGYPIRMKIQCKDSHGKNSETMKALVLQEMVKKGISINY